MRSTPYTLPACPGTILPRDHFLSQGEEFLEFGCGKLGQTVNSYVNQENGRPVSFAELLALVAGVPGIERVRFVTCYPGDFTDDIFEAMRDLPEVCEYLHIPAQSGSDAVLKRMRRRYTVGEYVDLIGRGRDFVPGLAVASDFIVGFCGETDKEHEASLRLIERCRFKNVFVFKYSERPGTVAQKRTLDDVPQEVKQRRNADLLACQEHISAAANQKLIGSTAEVLVEGYSKAAIKAQEAEQTRGHEVAPPPHPPLVKGGRRGGDEPEVGWRRSNQLVGRTRADRIVVFPGRPEHIGRFADVRITAATALTLHGTLIDETILSPLPGGTTGETRGAADGEKRNSPTSISGSPVSRSLPVIGSA